MFNPEEAFKKLNNKIFSHSALNNELIMVRAIHVSELPVELEVDDLYNLMLYKNWLIFTGNKIKVKI